MISNGWITIEGMSGKIFWSLKDIKRLMNCIDALNLIIPPDASDPHWESIDKLFRKPGKMKIINFGAEKS